MKITRLILLMVTTFGLVAGLPLLSAAAAPPTQVQIDQLSQDFAPVQFDHASHVDMVENCSECHHHTTGTASKDPDCMRCHDSGSNGERVACHDCHVAEPFSAEYLKKTTENKKNYHRDIPGLKGAYHRNCMGCHETSGGPTGCLDCHPRTEAGDALFHTGKYLPGTTDKAATH